MTGRFQRLFSSFSPALSLVRKLSSQLHPSLHIDMSYKPIVLSGPSGSGKSTLLKKLMAEHKGCFAFSVSNTTRKPRPGELDGVDYYFTTREIFEQMVENGDFVEYAEFSGNLYGTSIRAIEDIARSGRICILDVDLQGVKSIKETDLNPRYIFIKPPSIKVLEERLRGRGTENEDSLRKRLARVQEDFDYADQPNSYEHIIVNDDLEKAYDKLHSILLPEISYWKARPNAVIGKPQIDPVVPH